MPTFDVPQDWKGGRWWRNRPLDERMFHCRIPKRLQHTGVYDAEDTDRLAVWSRNFVLGNGLLLTGRSGSGKTPTAIKVLNTIMPGPTLFSARFVDTDDYIEMIKDSFDSTGSGLPDMYSNPYLLKLIKGVFDIVILDGLGNERQTDFAKHELGTLIRHRFDHGLTTIITSTMNLVELRSVYGARVSGPVEDMKQVKLGGQ